MDYVRSLVEYLVSGLSIDFTKLQWMFVVFRLKHKDDKPSKDGRVAGFVLRPGTLSIFCALSAMVLIFLIAFGIGLRDNAKQRAIELRFVLTVLLNNQHGDTKDVVRWRTPPKISLTLANKEDQHFISKVISNLNILLFNKNKNINITDRIKNSDIDIFFLNRSSFKKYAKQFDLQIKENFSGVGHFWCPQDKNNTPYNCTIFIGRGLSTIERRRTIIHEIVHAMGVANHSPLFKKSVMFQSGSRNSVAVKLAPIDRKLFRFLYHYLEPGDDVEAIRKSFEKYWRAIPDN